MPRAHKPRSGSLQFWPRVRAKRIYPRIRHWNKSKELKLLGFAGYKAGMTHMLIKDANPTSPTKNDSLHTPTTIIECPPLKVFSIVFYKKTGYGLKKITEIRSTNLDKELKRKVPIIKKTKQVEVEKILPETTEIRVVAYTQPKLTTSGKKKPDLIEIALGKDEVKKQYEFAKALLDKEIRVSEIFKPGQFVDIHSVSKGKGLQGPVKRFGISLKSHKSEKKRRAPANLGSWTPKKVSWRIPQKGQMGYHTRAEYNKLILDISNDPKKINSKAGFKRYGVIKNDYVLIKGSIPGPAKRMIRLIEPIRETKEIAAPEIKFISTR